MTLTALSYVDTYLHHFVDTFITMIRAWISSFKRGAITHKLARQGEKVGPFSPKMFGEHNTSAIILGLLYSLVQSAKPLGLIGR